MKIWMIGCNKIQFFNNDGEIDQGFDKANFEKKAKKKSGICEEKCAGIYCDLKNELNRIYDENEEEFNLYV